MLKEKSESKLDIENVQQKIIFESQLPFNPNQKVGPTVELFFHELSYDPRGSQKIVYFLTKLTLTLVFIASLPICAIGILLFSGRPVFDKSKVTGKRGVEFDYYSYSTHFNNPDKRECMVGRLIDKFGFHKLPSVINLWKGEIAVVGPACQSPEFCTKWNIKLSDFYKRFAFKPGFFGIAQPVDNDSNQEEVAVFLKQEFRYLLSPSLKKDLKFILG